MPHDGMIIEASTVLNKIGLNWMDVFMRDEHGAWIPCERYRTQSLKTKSRSGFQVISYSMIHKTLYFWKLFLYGIHSKALID